MVVDERKEYQVKITRRGRQRKIDSDSNASMASPVRLQNEKSKSLVG
jgi:hypothetical protein